jgi:hypothetical protein
MVGMIGLFLAVNACLVLLTLLAMMVVTVVVFVAVFHFKLRYLALRHNSLFRATLPGGETVIDQLVFIVAGRGHIVSSCFKLPGSAGLTAGKDASHLRKSCGKISVRRPHLTARKSPALMAAMIDVRPRRAFSLASEMLNASASAI